MLLKFERYERVGSMPRNLTLARKLAIFIRIRNKGPPAALQRPNLIRPKNISLGGFQGPGY